MGGLEFRSPDAEVISLAVDLTADLVSVGERVGMLGDPSAPPVLRFIEAIRLFGEPFEVASIVATATGEPARLHTLSGLFELALGSQFAGTPASDPFRWPSRCMSASVLS